MKSTLKTMINLKIMRDSIAVENDGALLIRRDAYFYCCNFIIVTDRYYTFQFA